MKEYKSLQRTTESEKKLPSEAMIFDGVILENEIDDYQTLSVTGRELVGYNVSSIPVDGMDGASYISASLLPRTITVRYKLKAETPEQLREKFNAMNQILKTKQAVISFMDEPEYEFIGTLGSADAVPEGVLSFTSAFDIYCADPYKYRTEESVTGTGSVEITQELAEGVVPSQIRLRTDSHVDRFVIENGDLSLRLKDASASVSPIYIYPETQEIVRNQIDRPDFLEWTSDFENFVVKTGDVIMVTPSDVEITIRVRERLR